VAYLPSLSRVSKRGPPEYEAGMQSNSATTLGVSFWVILSDQQSQCDVK
jgi:hypothetical protein